MSYLHCPNCSHAFNLAVNSQCPVCPVPATLVDPTDKSGERPTRSTAEGDAEVDDIVAAADALARAIARATPEQREAAVAVMPQSVMPQAMLAPKVARAQPAPRLLTRLAESLVDRMMEMKSRAKELEPKVIAMLPRRAGSILRRVRALAA